MTDQLFHPPKPQPAQRPLTPRQERLVAELVDRAGPADEPLPDSLLA
jgi:hypothetical protein